ncbi:IS200/IS605 family transposase [Limosilactobacillus fermentum]|nr:IS200/IS605 family transposase [Limosilactobacillus fermentum]UVW04550.1 IS200/IS605 family transposase [Limosilactobacillus fermentum]WEN06529.1 IS200/IS605 family transposase [Limosilactobacillus fermentum]WEN13386.1 IS200/IS605 family transposase [Limosilactobacillus fermentum]WJD40041.1 IS200/IS605 family transposase [Limosilactobacillus fermentum]
MVMAKEEIRDAVYTRRYIYNFHYHLIWVTKYHNKTFVTEQLSNEMKSILQLVADDNDIVIEKMEVIPDHVHVLISFPPSKAPTSAIKALKSRSAFIFLRRHPEIRQSQYWGGHLWSPSYYMSTLGNMSKEVVEQYINNQKYNETKKRPNGR